MVLTFLFLTPLWVLLVWCDKRQSVTVKVVAGIVFGFYAIIIYNTVVVNLRQTNYEALTRPLSIIDSTITPFTDNYYVTTISTTTQKTLTQANTVSANYETNTAPIATPIPTAVPTLIPIINYPTNTPLPVSSSINSSNICNHKALPADVSTAYFNSFVSTFEQGLEAIAVDWKYNLYISDRAFRISRHQSLNMG